MRVVSDANISLLSIGKADEPEFDDVVACLTINDEPNVLWRDWADARGDIFWLENSDMSGKNVEIALRLRTEPEEILQDARFDSPETF